MSARRITGADKISRRASKNAKKYRAKHQPYTGNWRDQPPTSKQLYAIAVIADKTGASYARPQTRGEASDLIERLHRVKGDRITRTSTAPSRDQLHRLEFLARRAGRPTPKVKTAAGTKTAIEILEGLQPQEQATTGS